ncbi:MAG: ferrous iron transport protein A [Lachnospiraceae bacterium]|nr:ferrous iron transport protein A [Lachnospiraceae bacterium]
MMPLSLLQAGQEATVCKVGGSPQLRTHLADLGFVAQARLSVIQSQGGNLIINLKESRLALTREMASKIMVV